MDKQDDAKTHLQNNIVVCENKFWDIFNGMNNGIKKHMLKAREVTFKTTSLLELVV